MIEEKKLMNENDIQNVLMIDKKIYKEIEAIIEFFFQNVDKIVEQFTIKKNQKKLRKLARSFMKNFNHCINIEIDINAKLKCFKKFILL